MTGSHVSLAWLAWAGGFWLASVWVQKGVRLRIAFFFPLSLSPYPKRPHEATNPLSLPPPQLQRGGPPGRRNPTRPGWEGNLWREEVQTLGGEGPELGVRETREPATPPARTGSPRRGSGGFWRRLRQRWGNAYESNLRPSAPELSVRFILSAFGCPVFPPFCGVWPSGISSSLQKQPFDLSLGIYIEKVFNAR